MAVPDDIEALLKRGETAKALNSAQSLARRRPRDAVSLDLLARSYAAAGQYKQALASYDRLARIAPQSAKPLADKAHLLQLTGEAKAAEPLLRKALAFLPLNGSLLRMLSVSTRLDADDPAVARVQKAWRDGTLPATEKIEAGYALFRALGRDGFTYLQEANDLQRKAHPWSLAKRRREVAGLQAALRAMPWPEPGPGAPGRLPIFVTGLPRSGTTLIEQILSCHPRVTAAGETGLTLRAAYSVLVSGQAFRPVSAIPAGELHLIGQRYVEGIDHFHDPGPDFTDKSIQTYMVMGLLAHVLPQARTIVVRRDPRDIGWSIYRNHFEAGRQGYSNDLRDIAAYIRTVDEMIAFWREIRPESFIEIAYEDLVRDPEPQIRRMLDYCGLHWDPACLAPEKNRRTVRTLSIEQVRAPISPKSIGGWRAYEQELAPLIESLEQGQV